MTAAALAGAPARLGGSTVLLADLSGVVGDDEAPLASWLPAPLPLGLRAVLTATSGSALHVELLARDDVRVLQLLPLPPHEPALRRATSISARSPPSARP